MQKEVNNRILYHFEDSVNNNEMWEVGNDFIIDDNYKSFAKYFFEDFPILSYNNKSLLDSCDDAIDGKLNKDELSELKNRIKAFINNQPIALKEYILENVRKQEFPNYISRTNCLFLTNKSSVKHWNEEFKNINKTLFEVEVSGLLFCGHDSLMPQKSQPILTQEWQAEQYWKGNLKANPYAAKNDIEYLFKGQVRVLRKIKKD